MNIDFNFTSQKSDFKSTTCPNAPVLSNVHTLHIELLKSGYIKSLIMDILNTPLLK